MNKYALIVAGGLGIRMGTNRPKQFLLLNGKSVLWHTVHAFVNSYSDIEFILVLPPGFEEEGQKIVHEFSAYKVQVISGGETRFHSVKNGLALIKKESIVFVHDGVRCLITSDLIRRCYEVAVEKGSAIPAIACKDSVRMVNGNSNFAIDRSQVMLIQTPQTFRSSTLLSAFQVDYNSKFTDEASVVELLGDAVSLIEGEESNIKITRPSDLALATFFLKTR